MDTEYIVYVIEDDLLEIRKYKLTISSGFRSQHDFVFYFIYFLFVLRLRRQQLKHSVFALWVLLFCFMRFHPVSLVGLKLAVWTSVACSCLLSARTKAMHDFTMTHSISTRRNVVKALLLSLYRSIIIPSFSLNGYFTTSQNVFFVNQFRETSLLTNIVNFSLRIPQTEMIKLCESQSSYSDSMHMQFSPLPYSFIYFDFIIRRKMFHLVFLKTWHQVTEVPVIVRVKR